jgi:hypothetical protein
MVATSSAPSSLPTRPPMGLVRWAWALFGGLLFQAFLGMGLNLYVVVPSSPTFTKIFVSSPLLATHIVLGFLLLAVALVSLLRVRGRGLVGIPWRAALVVVFLLLAIQEGFSYTFTLNDAFSYGMVVGFLGAVAFQAGVLYQLGRLAPAGA